MRNMCVMIVICSKAVFTFMSFTLKVLLCIDVKVKRENDFRICFSAKVYNNEMNVHVLTLSSFGSIFYLWLFYLNWTVRNSSTS